MKELYELKGEGHSIRGMARELGISRNTVRRYVRSPEVPKATQRSRRGSKLDHYKEYIDGRLWDGLDNCVVLLREIRELGYGGGYTTLKDYVKPRRRPRQPKATVRFEKSQASRRRWTGAASATSQRLDAGAGCGFAAANDGAGLLEGDLREVRAQGRRRQLHQMSSQRLRVLRWSPRRCLYDNAKVVVLGRDEDGGPQWNSRMLDFARRVGFDPRLCRPYRAQTKGKVESGVKYVRNNFWPSVRFTDDADLNRQAIEWCDAVANDRVHGTTARIDLT